VLLDEGAGLTRALLGIGREGIETEGLPPEMPSAAGWFSYAPLGRHHHFQ
jgi:hypothetical protein